MINGQEKGQTSEEVRLGFKLAPPIIFAIFLCTIAFQITMLPFAGFTGLGVFGLSMLIAWIIVLRKRLLHIFPVIIGLMTLFSSIGLILQANEFLQMLFTFVLLATQCLLFVYFVWGKYNFTFSQTLILLPKSLFNNLRQLEEIISSGRINSGHNLFGSWLKTGLMTLTIIGFFALLLFQADPLFAALFKNVQFGEIATRIIWFFIIAIGLTVWWTTPKDSTDIEDAKLSLFSIRDFAIVMSGLIVLFGSFLIIQWQYLFAGNKELLIELDLTLSEYVRKGFLELLWVVFFGSILVYINSLKLRVTSNSNLSKYLQFLTSFTVIELFLILASAFKRNLMYVEAYGLTRMRIVGEVFLVWLSCSLIFLLIFVIIRKIKEQIVFYGVLSVSLGATVFFTLFNMDRYLWISAPKHHDYTDFFYLSNLSADVGDILFTQSLPKINAEISRLTSKSSLDEIDKTQLAGIKLALLALREQRNQAYLQAASSEDIWSKDKLLGFDFNHQFDNYNLSGNKKWRDNFINTNRYELKIDQFESISAKLNNNIPATQSALLPKFINNQRSWRRISVSQNQLNQYVISHPELFQQIDELIMDIRSYQIIKQLDLSNQEKVLLYDLEYPLINIKIEKRIENLGIESK